MHLPCVPLAQAAYDGQHVRPKQIEQKLILTALPVAIEPEEFLNLGDDLPEVWKRRANVTGKAGLVGRQIRDCVKEG